MFNLLKRDPFNFFGQAMSFAPEGDGTALEGSTGLGAGDHPVDSSIVDLKETLTVLNKLPEGEREAARDLSNSPLNKQHAFLFT